MPFYLTPKQDDFNKIPELQICIVEALYDSQQAIVAKLNKRGVLTRGGKSWSLVQLQRVLRRLGI
jgi:hypothetical protein